MIAWIGLLWWMMVCWSQHLRGRPNKPWFVAALAVVAGLSVLVRPELALIGGVALVLLIPFLRRLITDEAPAAA